MDLKIIRKYKKQNYTIGKLYINNQYFCDTLEDTERGLTSTMPLEEIKKIKVKGETAIPSGTYQVLYTYSPKFKRMLPLINNVKGFEGIRIHSGNTAKDSLGCVLLGFNKEKGKVLQSRDTCNSFYKIIEDAITKRGEAITLKIE